MKAIVQDTYGSADVLELRDIDLPEIADDQVLVRVHAAGVDRGVWHLMAGLPYPIRMAGYGVRAPKYPVLGMDLAGVVEAVGKDVTRFAPATRCSASARAPSRSTPWPRRASSLRSPRTSRFEQAAAIAISGLTALQALRDVAKVHPGQRVLIIGASGGVGTYAVQVAKAFGAHVTGVCSTSKVDMVRAIGADEVIDYTVEDFAAGDARYDVIVDIGGNASLGRLRRALTPTGTVAIVGQETGGRWLGGFDRMLRAPLLSPFVSQDLRSVTASENAADMVVLKDMIEAGQVTPVIERSYALAEVPDAIRHIEQGRARGKVVITI